MEVLFVLVSVGGAWWVTWRAAAKIAKNNGWKSLWRYVACTTCAAANTFAALCLSGAIFFPETDPSKPTAPALLTVGTLLLGGMSFVLWMATRASLASVMPPLNESVNKDVGDSANTDSSTLALPRVFFFKYIDQHGRSTNRRVRVSGVFSNDGRNYLEGFCLVRHAIRSFRVDRIQGDLADDETGELVNVYTLLAEAPKSGTLENWDDEDEYFQADERPSSVLFTGFAKAQRLELEALAVAANWNLRPTVSYSLDFLVCGPKAGSAKIAQAEAIGVAVVDEQEFKAMLTASVL